MLFSNRRYLFVLACLLFAGRADATITKVQSRIVTYPGTSSPRTLAFSSNTTAGNTIIVSCGAFATFNDNIPTIFDSNAPTMTYTEAIHQPGTNFNHSVAVYANIVGGADTVTCAVSNGTFFTIIIAEYSGVDIRFPVDVAASKSAYSGSGNTKSAGAFNTVQANEMLLAFYYDDHNSGGAGAVSINSGFTKQEEDISTNTQGAYADLYVTSIQTGINPTWSNASWAGDGVTLISIALRESFSSAPGVSLFQKAGAKASAVSVAVPFGSSNVAGNMIFATCFGSQATLPVLTIADTAGNTYTAIDNVTAGTQKVNWWYAKNIAAGANTVTCTSSQTGSALHLALIEYQGLSTTAPLDQHQALQCGAPCGTDPSFPAQPTAITTTSAKELLVFAVVTGIPSGSGINVAPPNYTFRQSDQDVTISSQSIYVADQYLTATGTYQPYTHTISQSQFYMLSASFIEAPAATSGVKHRAQVIRHKEKKVKHAQILTASL